MSQTMVDKNAILIKEESDLNIHHFQCTLPCVRLVEPFNLLLVKEKAMFKKTMMVVAAVAGFMSLGSGVSYAADTLRDQTRDQDRIHTADQDRLRTKDQDQTRQQDRDQVYGSQLMTAHERNEYRAKMRSMKTREEREAFRLEHHKQMQERARAQGVTLPDMPPAAGAGMGPGGMGSGGRNR